ncbi:MAG: hypothetical protein VXW32_04530 [Myxococcota bacterium]|nr:hypothetical protein [Myxococcota bacterium]
MTLLRCLGLWLFPLVALAGSDLAPFNGGGGIQVADEGKPSKIFYPLEPGGYLDYAFAGPGRVWIFVRSGARPKGSWSYPLSMELPLEVVSTRIDGVPLTPAIDETGALRDTDSTYPWLSKGILIDVPEGSTSFRLPSQLDAPPLLVRVMVPGAQAEPPNVAEETPPTAVDESVEATVAEIEEEPALLDDLFYGEEEAIPESAEGGEEPDEELEDESTSIALAPGEGDADSDSMNEDQPATPDEVAPDSDSMNEDQPATPEEVDPDSEATTEDQPTPLNEGGEGEVLTDEEPTEANPDPSGSEELVDDADAVPEIIEALPVEPVGEDTFGGRYEIFDEEAQTLEDVSSSEELEEIDDLDDESAPEAVVLGSLGERLVHALASPRVTGGLGLGAPLQGSDIVVSGTIGARVELLPVLTDSWKAGWGRLDLEVSAGWYRIGVRESVVVYDAIAGDSSLDVRYATQVYPILFGLHYDLPVRLGSVLPYAGASGGFAVAHRAGEASVTNASGAWSGKFGLQIEAGPVSVLPQVSYTGTSAVLDRLSEDGCFANENLSSIRLDVAVQAQF